MVCREDFHDDPPFNLGEKIVEESNARYSSLLQSQNATRAKGVGSSMQRGPLLTHAKVANGGNKKYDEYSYRRTLDSLVYHITKIKEE